MSYLITTFQMLTFRIKSDDIYNFNKSHLRFGLFGTWVVGMGRYWDDDKANIVQLLGIGSLVYIFALALIFKLLISPYKIKSIKYFHILTFISLTSFPAILYSIPVEKYFLIEKANEINRTFLIIVAIWRISLILFFFKKVSFLKNIEIITITFLPICVILTTLTILNLNHTVLNLMGGIRGHTSVNDTSYNAILDLSFFSMLMFLPFSSYYIYSITRKR